MRRFNRPGRVPATSPRPKLFPDHRETPLTATHPHTTPQTSNPACCSTRSSRDWLRHTLDPSRALDTHHRGNDRNRNLHQPMQTAKPADAHPHYPRPSQRPVHCRGHGPSNAGCAATVEKKIRGIAETATRAPRGLATGQPRLSEVATPHRVAMIDAAQRRRHCRRARRGAGLLGTCASSARLAGGPSSRSVRRAPRWAGLRRSVQCRRERGPAAALKGTCPPELAGDILAGRRARPRTSSLLRIRTGLCVFARWVTPPSNGPSASIPSGVPHERLIGCPDRTKGRANGHRVTE